MPIYEMRCPKCQREYEFMMKISEYGKRQLECEDCIIELERYFKSAPNFTIPGHSTYNGITKVSGGSKKGQNEAAVPINIIDQNPDGSCRVTRIGKKSDIEND